MSHIAYHYSYIPNCLKIEAFKGKNAFQAFLGLSFLKILLMKHQEHFEL